MGTTPPTRICIKQGRSQDSVQKKVIALQEKAWKLAERKEFWPDDSVRLDDWTAKDNCKLMRAFREGTHLQDAKDRFFARWTMDEVNRKVKAYRQQIRAKGIQPSQLAERMASTMDQSRLDSSPAH